MSSLEFKAALKRYEHLAKTLGDDHDITTQAFTDCFYLAPPEYVEEAHRIAGEMNLLPEATGYLDDGSPLYSLADIAKHNGITFERAERDMHNMMAARKAAGLPIDGIVTDSNLIHRKQ